MNKPMAGACVSLYLLLTSFTQKSASFNRNDYVYDRGSRTFYKEHTAKVTWQQAVDTCASEGAQLAVPTIEAELNALIKYRSKNTNIWLGIHDLFGEGRFISLNGIPDTDLYTKWMDNEPNNLNDGEHCVILDANGGYNDVNCEYLVAFVCTGNVIYDPLYDQEGSSEPYFREDYVYNRAFQSFYKHHAVPLSWADAVTRCAAEGATLAAPLTADERDAILYHMMRGSASIWLGIHDHKSTGSFFTLDGTPVSNIFVDWAENEPNNGGDGEHCVQLYSTGFYNDNDCRQAYFFVCKKNITSLTTSNPMCETYDTEYKYNINSNRCYKYHATPSTWHEAYKTCYDEGSHLGMVNSALEAQVYLNTLINDSSSKEAQSENFKMQLIHLGFSKLLGAGVFKTIKGKTLDFSGYNEWASGQPKNAGTNARCGAMASLDGKLHAASCHLRKSFICEKNLHRPLSLDASLRYGTGDVHFCVNNP